MSYNAASYFHHPIDALDELYTMEQLCRDILEAVEQPGQFKNWLQQRSESPSAETGLKEALVMATEELLSADPPKAAEWEQLLIQLAVHSRETPQPFGLDACKSVVGKVREMFEADAFARVEHRKIVTIAGALTVALTAQRKLRQPIELAMRSLCERSEVELAQIGQQCQGIWKRKGQMSGEQGLFVWDTRNCEWRLTQDFKSNQPES